MEVFNIYAKLSLDSSGFNSSLDHAVSSAKTFAGTFAGSLLSHAVMGGLNLLANGVQKAIDLTFQLGKSAVDAAVDYEAAFTGIRKTVDATDEDIAKFGSAEAFYEDLSKWLGKASTEMAISRNELAEVGQTAGQLGIRGSDNLKQFIETCAKIGISTDLTADEAAMSFARILNITGESASDLDKLGAVVTALGNNFATNEPQIIAMANRLASTGTISGLSSKEIMALAAAMSSAGIQAEAGGTAMTQTLTAISQAVSSAASGAGDSLDMIAQVAGMSADKFSETWKTKPIDAVMAFISGLNHLEEKGMDINSVLGMLEMDGIRQGNMLKSLALMEETLTKAVDTATDSYKSSGEELNALDTEVKKYNESTWATTEMVKNAWTNLKTAIGTDALPAYKEFLGVVKNGLVSITEAYEEGGFDGLFDQLKVEINNIIAWIMEKIPEFMTEGGSLIGSLIKGITDKLPEVLKSAKQTIIEYLKGIGDNLHNLVKAGADIIRAIYDAIGANVQTITGVIVELIGFIVETISQNIGPIYNAAITLVASLAKGIGEGLPEMIPAIVSMLLTIVDVLVENAPLLIEAATALITGLADGIINSLPLLIQNIPQIMTAIVQALVLSVPQLITAAIQILMALGNGIIANLPVLSAQIPKVISSIVLKLIELAPELLKAAMAIINALATGLVEWLPLVLSTGAVVLVELLKSLVEEAVKLIDAGKAMGNRIKEGLNGAIQAAKQWGIDLMNNFAEGILAKIDYVVGLINQLAARVKELMGFSEPEKGPLSDFHTYAPDMMKLFAQGIKDNTHLVTDQIKKSFDFGGLIKDQDVNFSQNVKTVSEVAGGSYGGANSFVQNLTINAPTEQNPSEIARLTRNANREMVLNLRMA